MKTTCVFCALIFGICLTSYSVSACEDDYSIAYKVRYIGVLCEVGNQEWLFSELAKKSEQSLCSLVKQLNATTIREIFPEDWEKEIQAKNQVWRMRALRFLTCGKEFTASTRYETLNIRNPEGYWNWVGGSKAATKNPGDRVEVWFFGTWMSRDIDYLAPVDAQKDIIRQWREWLVTNGTNTGCTPDPKDYNQWYF